MRRTHRVHILFDFFGTLAMVEAAVFVGDRFQADFEGPRRAGMLPQLVDPYGLAPVPPAYRLSSVFDLPARLGQVTGPMGSVRP